MATLTDQDDVGQANMPSGLDYKFGRRETYAVEEDEDVDIGADMDEDDEEDDDDDDDDYEMYGIHQALPIPDGEPNWDLPEPDTVEEYLRRVRWEAARVPKVLTSAIVASTFASQQTNYVPHMDAIPEPPSWAQIDTQWLQAFVVQFQQLRQYLAQLSEYQEAPSTSLPHVNDVQAWDRLCFGRQVLDTSTSSAQAACMSLLERPPPPPPSPPPPPTTTTTATAEAVAAPTTEENVDVSVSMASIEEASADIATPSATTVVDEPGQLQLQDEGQPHAPSSNNDDGFGSGEANGGGTTTAAAENDLTHESEEFAVPGPMMTTVTAMDQVAVVCILQRHIEQLARTSLSLLRAQWLFALTARLDKPIHADTAASLTQLLRRCCSLRSVLEAVDAPTLPLLNILIAISGAYFGQDEQLTRTVNQDLL